MSKNNPKTANDCVKLAQQNGFRFNRQSGSHAIYSNNTGKIAIIPMHKGDIPRGTLKSIMKMIGIITLLVVIVLIIPDIKYQFELLMYNLYWSY